MGKTLTVLVWCATLTLAVHIVLNPFYRDSVDTGLVWNYVNRLTAFGGSRFADNALASQD